jgi:polysaccharide biosynthesis protein PslH
MPDKPLNILQICFRMPYPLKDGGAIAMYYMTKGFYDNGCNLTLLVPITSKHDLEINDLPLEIRKMADIHTVKINTDITLVGAFKNLFSKEAYYLSRYYDHGFDDKLIEILKSKPFDIVHIESLKMGGYLNTIRENTSASVVMRSHNVEFMIWQRMAQATKSVLKKWYLKILVGRIKKQEIGTMNLYDALVPITTVDGDFFVSQGCRKPVFPTPAGLDLNKLKPDTTQIESNSLFHLGALDWMPNLEALKWFMKNSWPLIHDNYPEVKFYIAGRNMPDEIRKYCTDNVIISGEVEDATEFMNSKQIMIVPLLSGSGMRLKIVEGMALGKIIISTTVGAEGIGCKNLNNIMIADTALEFAEIVGKIINDKHFADQISANAIEFIHRNYDNNIFIHQLIYNYRHLSV